MPNPDRLFTFQRLVRARDLAAVETLRRAAADYWELAEGRTPGRQQAEEFFDFTQPQLQPDRARRLGLYLDGTLAGLAELQFGFPTEDAAYLGLMVLMPDARGAGLGRAFLAHIEEIARHENAPALYLGVLEANRRGRTFWERAGFQDTGISRVDESSPARHLVHRLVKTLA